MKAAILSFLIVLISTAGAYANDYMGALNPPTTQDSQNQRNWNKFLDIVEHTGKILEAQYGDYLFIESIDPEDKSKSHYANYFSLVGGLDSNGKFHFNRIEVVSENWQLKEDGNWHIDQYLFRLSPDQEIMSSMHIDMVQTLTHTVIKHDYIEMDEVQSKQEWARLRNDWYARIGLD